MQMLLFGRRGRIWSTDYVLEVEFFIMEDLLKELRGNKRITFTLLKKTATLPFLLLPISWLLPNSVVIALITDTIDCWTAVTLIPLLKP